MNARSTSTLGHVALMVAHCAGMVDLVALPVWVGTLIQHFKLDPQQAGGLATLFLIASTIGWAYLLWRFIEEPAREWMRSKAGARRVPTEEAGEAAR